MSDIVEEALNAKYVVISKCGPHAGEGYAEMFHRRQGEIATSELHRSFWYYRSWPAKPDRPWTADPKAMQEFCRKAVETQCGVYCVFTGGGTGPGVTALPATHFSELGPCLAGDRELPEHFKPIPRGIYPTGLERRRTSYAMVFSELADSHDLSKTVCLWDYSQYGHPGSAICGGRQNSTHLCEKASSRGDERRMYKPLRGKLKVVGVGRLVEPFAVWLAWAPARSGPGIAVEIAVTQ